MAQIGLYNQLTNFSTEHAGTAEWCKAERDGKEFFIKKFHSPVYPSKDIGLPEKMYTAGVEEFHKELNRKKNLYKRLRECDQSGVLVVPVEVINYQFHICTIAEFVVGNVLPEQIHLLSEWQRLVLLRTLTLALMNVHKAGVVHSDMKPDNVLVTQDGNGHCKLRLIDFDGSFFETDPPLDPEDVVGDPAFFSPEAYRQSMDEDIRLDHRIDVFALGLIFHYFWTGSYPDRPENRTIGESLIRNETITVNESIPLVLKQLIQKMIEKDPDQRISLKSVYDVLGVQIGLYPPTIINIQTEQSSAPPKKKQKEEKEKEVKYAEVIINHISETGVVLRSGIIKIPYGSSKIVTAETIEGYHANCLKTKEVRVLANGYVNSPVEFTYSKNVKAGPPKKGKHVAIALIALAIMYLLVVYLSAQSAMGMGDYSRAKQYMDVFPFYDVIFPDDYNYSLGVEYFNKMLYKDAHECFSKVNNKYDSKYKPIRSYINKCEEELKNPSK